MFLRHRLSAGQKKPRRRGRGGAGQSFAFEADPMLLSQTILSSLVRLRSNG
ncbi:hypothetical protein Mnod_1628 [Methylobacterium nodulans ORS 2060]|uniref:Uncharacterized protein n=1 Tax=Methylobacterium nodulans (strain LMG 21967 / CNCM I-2342 / ORS 2060) TaxID=460265 RepID=B8IPW8_METNO|nr:hypothetical protein Mnod_1628 [Methylobacterium nodulans ORS 2060]